MTLQAGIPFPAPPSPISTVGQYPQKGYATTQAPLVWYDQNAGRPARQNQWSIGLQRNSPKIWRSKPPMSATGAFGGMLPD